MPLPIPRPDADQIAKRFPSLSACMTALYEQVCRPGITPPRMFEPRRIVPPGGYHSPKLIAASLFTILGENGLKLRANEFMAPTAITAQEIAYEVTNNNVPIYYISDALSRAVAATELPSGIKIEDLNLPMPALVLGFPQRFMLEYLGLDVCYVFAARLSAGAHRSRHIPYAPVIETPADKVAWFWFCCTPRRLEAFVSSYWCRDDINQTLAKYDYTDYTNAAPDLVAQNRDSTEKVSALMLKLLCVLNWRDRLIEPAHCIRPSKYKGAERTELWSANIASPRLHWRRGHATFQVIGKKEDLVPVGLLARDEKGEIDWPRVNEPTRARFWASHKRVWVDPILVGAPPELESNQQTKMTKP